MHTAMGLDQKGNNNESQCLACHGVPTKRKVQMERANPTPGGAFQASKQASDLLDFLVMPLRDGVQAGETTKPLPEHKDLNSGQEVA